MAPPVSAVDLDVEVVLGLAVTARCCAADLSDDPDSDLRELAARHKVVAKFIELRAKDPEGQERIRSVSAAVPVYSLHSGRLRAATCPDRTNQCVWLLASRTHRGGEREDSYPYFERLHAAGHLMPSEDDYARLFRRRNATVIPVMVSRLRATLFQARENQGGPQTVLLPGGLVVTILVEWSGAGDETPIVEELHLAVSRQGLQDGWLPIIQATLSPDEENRVFEYTSEFPGRAPDQRELRYRFWQEVVPND